jgi:hypothetical protein
MVDNIQSHILLLLAAVEVETDIPVEVVPVVT